MPDQIDVGKLVDEALASLVSLIKFSDDPAKYIPQLKEVVKTLTEDTDAR